MSKIKGVRMYDGSETQIIKPLGSLRGNKRQGSVNQDPVTLRIQVLPEVFEEAKPFADYEISREINKNNVEEIKKGYYVKFIIRKNRDGDSFAKFYYQGKEKGKSFHVSPPFNSFWDDYHFAFTIKEHYARLNKTNKISRKK